MTEVLHSEKTTSRRWPSKTLAEKNYRREPTGSKALPLFSLPKSSPFTYRRAALFLKSAAAISSFLLISSNAYGTVSLSELGKVSRIMGPLNEIPQISTERFDKGGSLCGEKPSSDLVLRFAQMPNEWIAGLVDLKKNLSADSHSLCDLKASPVGDGEFEIRFSYRQDPKKKKLEFLSFKTSNSFTIDFWQTPEAKQSVPAKAIAKQKELPSQKSSSTKVAGDGKYKFNPLAGYATQGTLVDAFEDEAQWDRLLGADASSFDLNTPELDRFRYSQSVKTTKQLNETIERADLKLPFFALPAFESTLEFPLDLFVYKEFSLASLDKTWSLDSKGAAFEKAKGAVKGMNFVQRLVKEKEYLKARQALEILESSQVRASLPVKNPQWWALKGHLFVNLGKELKEKNFMREGLNYWRDGAILLAGASDESQPYVEFMTSRLVRNFFEDKQYYLSASILTWSKKYSWSQRLEERFAYFRAEVLYQLNLFDEAKEQFNLFYKMREDKPINAFIDRRLVPAAAFRLGDIAFRMRDYREAAVQYGWAMNNVPTVAKFAFEGNWYPEEIALFPHVLFNRAEAFIRVGAYQQALKDLRGFVYIAPQHPRSSQVLYRIGDLLDYLGAPEDKVLGAWRECIFRFPGTLGGKLCEARKSAREFVESDNKVNWPRLIGMIDEALPIEGKKFWSEVPKDELQTYVNLILADAFIKKSEPRQALFRLDPLFKLGPSEEMGMWLHEYATTAIAGTFLKDYREGRYKEIVQSYEKRRREILSNQTRHDILWALALAYEKLNLIDEANQVLTQAERVKSVIARQNLRPFEATPDEWSEFRARLNLRLFTERKIAALSVEDALKKTNPDSMEALRMKAEFYSMTGRYKTSAENWKKITAKDHLRFDEVKKYAQVLKEIKENKTRATLLETQVGTWLTEKNKSGADSMPPADLLMDLAEIRGEQSSKWLGALSIYDFLLSLDVSKLGPVINQAMINFRRGQILRSMGKNDDARQSFERAKTLEPDGVWGKLGSSALKELDALQASQSSGR